MNGPARTWIVVAVAVITTLVGIRVLAVPVWKDRTEKLAAIEDLRGKMAGIEDQESTERIVRARLAELRDIGDRTMKRIPARADVAEVIGQLSMPADGVTIVEQQFNTGTTGDAVPGGPEIGIHERMTPVTIDMVCDFGSVFAIIRAAERLDRLVRVDSVRIDLDRERTRDGRPMLDASIGLAVIHERSGEDG